jgi:hypothetical protein
MLTDQDSTMLIQTTGSRDNTPLGPVNPPLTLADPEAGNIQGLIALNSLPQKWEMLSSIVLQNYDVEDLTFTEGCDVIISHY